MAIQSRRACAPWQVHPDLCVMLLRCAVGGPAHWGMKFGKRLAAEAARLPDASAAYFDYKSLKKSIRDDVAAKGERRLGVNAAVPALQWHVALVGHTPLRKCPCTTCADSQGGRFQELLVSELQKVSQFYSARATELEVRAGNECWTSLCGLHGPSYSNRVACLRCTLHRLLCSGVRLTWMQLLPWRHWAACVQRCRS
jgi:hypothetical protein